jgi:hypothetical protein
LEGPEQSGLSFFAFGDVLLFCASSFTVKVIKDGHRTYRLLSSSANQKRLGASCSSKTSQATDQHNKLGDLFLGCGDHSPHRCHYHADATHTACFLTLPEMAAVAPLRVPSLVRIQLPTRRSYHANHQSRFQRRPAQSPPPVLRRLRYRQLWL